jgi:hypothetical protein
VPVQYKSAATVLAFHEMLSHMVQAAILHDKIQQGVVPKCMGLTTVHGPEQFQSEGLAQTLTYFLDTSDTRPDLVAARRELMIYEAMVNSNVHLMVMSGKGILECHDYCTERLPFKTQIEIENGISNRVHNPQFRCYEYVYGSSAAFFKKFAQQASPSQKQEFLNRIYNDWLPVEELAGLIAGPLNPSSPKPASLVMQSRL